jgi:hypothetical protein
LPGKPRHTLRACFNEACEGPNLREAKSFGLPNQNLGGLGSLSARQARITRSSRFNATRGAAQQLLEFPLLRGNPVCGDFALGFHKIISLVSREE